MSRYFLKNGEVYIDRRMQEKILEIVDGKLYLHSKEMEIPEGSEVLDMVGKKIVPGWIDIHTHGGVGVDNNSATAEDFEKICQFFSSNGTTSWFASILTDSKEQTLWCIDQFNRHKELEHHGANLLGLHLEGPFLASAYKGAMPEHLLKPYDFALLREYQERAKGGIRYITVAPEVEGVCEGITSIQELGIVVSVGHSGADYDTVMKSIERGVSSSTHTFNAMQLLHQHFPSVMGAALESDIYCEAICDGRHLHPGVVRLLIKTKGVDKVIAITDSIMAAGLPDGEYKLGVNNVVVKDGDAKLVDTGVRAGSTLTQDIALKNILKFTGKELEEILPMFSENPAKMFGIFDKKGSIADGKDADLVILNKENDVVGVYVGGKKVK